MTVTLVKPLIQQHPPQPQVPVCGGGLNPCSYASTFILKIKEFLGRNSSACFKVERTYWDGGWGAVRRRVGAGAYAWQTSMLEL